MKRIYKSRTNKRFDGVLGGIGTYFSIDPTILRVIFVVLMFPSFWAMVPLYVVLSWVMPEEPWSQRSQWDDSNVFVNRSHQRPRKEAKPVHPAEDDEEWSDF